MTPNTLTNQYARTRTLLLDMDGTLLDLHFDSYFCNEHLPRRFAEIHNHYNDPAQHSPINDLNELLR